MAVVNVAAAHITVAELAANRLFGVRLAPSPPPTASWVSTKESGNGFSFSAI